MSLALIKLTYYSCVVQTFNIRKQSHLLILLQVVLRLTLIFDTACFENPYLGTVSGFYNNISQYYRILSQ